MEEIRITVEIEGEVEMADRLAIEDAVYDALQKIGYEVNRVKVSF